MAVCAHPGHGSEYIEEVPSSQPEPSSQVSNPYSEPVYSSHSGESSSSAPSSSSSQARTIGRRRSTACRSSAMRGYDARASSSPKIGDRR